ncbi:hypothetical protein OH76DRAFT_367352 [Lentinus brumalis]|uniref:Uncharacterized protein n=1 Tax=Lentinus brumalis TaxID=2498619 RepID=A0A371DE66_9APHY|nr:hypothetical protein OH76DRAFT_367352 [Polyporus brumalis]
MPDPLPENVLVEEQTKIVQALYERQQRIQDGASVVAGFLILSGVLVRSMRDAWTLAAGSDGNQPAYAHMCDIVSGWTNIVVQTTGWKCVWEILNMLHQETQGNPNMLHRDTF